jgi:hypothetical protein
MLCLCLLLCVLEIGCATKSTLRNATQTFGSATERIGRMGEDEFVTIRAETVAMNKAMLVLSQDMSAQDLVYDTPSPARGTAERVMACKALRHYGELLLRLTSDDRVQFVEKSCLAFTESMSAALHAEPTPAQRLVLSQIDAGLHETWTAGKRAQVIADVVLAYEESVSGLADLLLADFSLASPGYLKAYADTAAALQQKADAIIDAGEEYDLQDRQDAADASFLARQATTRATELGARIEAGLGSLKRNNAELADRLRNRTMDQADFRNFAVEIHRAGSMQQVLSR